MKYIVIGIVVASIIGIGLWLRDVPESTVIETPAPEATGTQESEASDSTEQKTSTTNTTSTNSEQTTTNNIITKNGMKIEITKEGTGEAIVNGQVASMLYTGTLTDGTLFDSTSKRNDQPFEFILGAGQVIKGWDQGILGMKVGEERTLTIPAELGYGAQGAGGVIPPNATLVFTVKLLAIK